MPQNPIDLGPFASRHIGPRDAEIAEMLDVVGVGRLDELIDAAVPEEIRSHRRPAGPRTALRGRGPRCPSADGLTRTRCSDRSSAWATTERSHRG